MRRLTCVLVLLTVGSAAGVTAAADAPPRTVVLDAAGAWRLYHTLAPPVVETGKGLEPVLAIGQRWLHEKTPEPSADWRRPDFDDHAWLHGPARIAVEAPMVRRLCLRGKFIVTDPARVRDLKLSVGYHGGVIVGLNGTEIARNHLATGEEGRLGLAETYPEEACYYGETRSHEYRDRKGPELARIRTRRLDDVTVPARLLRKGVNVVTLEIVRPAEHRSVVKEAGWHKHRTPVDLNWNTCAIRDVQLAAPDAHGLVQNAVRPAGVQVWNASLLANDFSLDFGDTAEPLRPVEITGVRNGSFSGKVVLGDTGPIKGLVATMSDLRGPGVIPAVSVRVRFAAPWDDEIDAYDRYPVRPQMLGALLEKPPGEVPVRADLHRNPDFKRSPVPVPGAVVPVWVTVDVPAHVPAGDYAGTLTLRFEGRRPVEVPVHLDVEDWTLPDPQDYRTWVALIQSPDTLVVEYGLQPWSPRHWTMMTGTFDYLRRIGSRILYVPVICRTNMGNEESMVRWIEKPDGTYTWDFSLMDRYLDTATAHMGKPKVVVFWVWEKFMFPTVDDPKTFEQYRPNARVARTADGPDQYIGRGPLVTVLDPATGKTENRHLPYLLDPRSKDVWRPLFETLRARMKARGLEETMMIGTPSDIVLRKDQFAFFNEVAPGWRWVNHSHFDVTDIYKSCGAKLGYYTTVMNVLFPGYPEDGRHYGWKGEELHAHLRSCWGRDYFPLTTWR
ncbi:MAG TPA: glycoside hydrolase domain-containing protein, partial [Planctomycetota bacterium]|nr:glycoside hydrolase domain-containing protein [Planctomycetota bacterium]